MVQAVMGPGLGGERLSGDGSGEDGSGGVGSGRNGSVGDGSVRNGSVAKKVAADLLRLNWLGPNPCRKYVQSGIQDVAQFSTLSSTGVFHWSCMVKNLNNSPNT
jgi:hypothetical protein